MHRQHTTHLTQSMLVQRMRKIPSTVAELRVRWNQTKNRASPRCSPNNSDDEEEEDVNGEEGGEMGTTGLVFEHDKSED